MLKFWNHFVSDNLIWLRRQVSVVAALLWNISFLCSKQASARFDRYRTCDYDIFLQKISSCRTEASSQPRKKPQHCWDTFLGCGDRTRTCDLVVMSHASCRCSTPRQRYCGSLIVFRLMDCTKQRWDCQLAV